MLVAPPHPEDREESRERQNPRRRRGYDLSWTSLDRHVVHAHLESQHIVRFRKSKRQRRVDMAVEQRGDVDGEMGVPETGGSPGLVLKRFSSTSPGARLNGSAPLAMMSTRACWLRVGVEKSRVLGAKKAPARFPIKRSKLSVANETNASTVKA